MSTLKNLTEKQIKNLAADLAFEFRNKDVTIGLIGDLGAGKTTFTKSFAKALGIKKIKSPTFIVVAEYKLPKQKFYHIDFYRLNHLDQLQHIGLTDTLNSKNRIVIIEWADKFPQIQKQCDLVIKFRIKDSKTRDVTINAK